MSKPWWELFNESGLATRTVCDSCGEKVEMTGHDWAILATYKLIHYGGIYGDACYQTQQREKGNEPLENTAVARE